jgi:hypothetical protein
MCITQAADIFGTGIVAGAFVMGAIAVHPAAARLDASPHVILRQELIRRLQRFLPPFMLLPVPASTAAMTLCRMSVSRLARAGSTPPLSAGHCRQKACPTSVGRGSVVAFCCRSG